MRAGLIVLALGLVPPSVPDGPRFEPYSGPYQFGLTVVPPWADGGKLVVNLPEHLEYESRGMGILRHNDKERTGTWTVAADGLSATLDVESTTAPGVRVTGRAVAKGADRIELTMRITNGGRIPLPVVKPLYCFHYRTLAGFPQWVGNFKHTYVVMKGKPVALSLVSTEKPDAKVKGGTISGCRQQGNGFVRRNGGLIESGLDTAIAAVTALDGRRKMVISWSPGKSILSNANIPCLHADPYYGTIEPGASAEAKGVIRFTEGSLEEAVEDLRKAGWGKAIGRAGTETKGLAAKYPGDAGLGDDPAVLLFEDFETQPKLVSWMKKGGWFGVKKIARGEGLELTGKIAAAGKRSLRFNLKTGKKSAGGIMHLLKPSRKLYFRYYRMFEKNWEWPRGYGPHDVGIYGWKGKFPGPAGCDLFFLVDFWMSADTMLRVGTPRQKINPSAWLKKKKFAPPPPGGHGVPWNKSKPDKIVPRKWHCVEVMVELSSPGKEDGATMLWVNGKLVSDVKGLPLRDEEHGDMLFTMFFLSGYFHPGSPKDQTHWMDQVVIATEYIGPIREER